MAEPNLPHLACQRVLTTLPKTAARSAMMRVFDATHVVDPVDSLDAAQCMIWSLAMSACVPELPLSMLDDAPVHLLDASLVERWAHWSPNPTDSALVLLGRHPSGPTIAAGWVGRLIGAGRLGDARRVMDIIPWTDKTARGLALVELAFSDDAATLREAIDAVVNTEMIMAGPHRGGDEIRALGEMLARVAEHPHVPTVQLGSRLLVREITRLATAGQRWTKPSGFANLLSQLSVSCAERTGLGTEHHLEYAAELSTAIAFDDIRLHTEGALRAALSRIHEGVRCGTRPSNPWCFVPVLPTSTAWRTQTELADRIRSATPILADAYDRKDWERYFDALAVALDPAGMTLGDRLLAWDDSPAELQDRALLAVLRADQTPDNRWCTLAEAERAWAAIETVADSKCAKELIAFLFDGDFVTRARTIDGGYEPSYPIAVAAVTLASRHGYDILERLVERSKSSVRPKTDLRLFDALVMAVSLGGVELASLMPLLSRPLAWVLWSAVGELADLSLTELQERFGPPIRNGSIGCAHCFPRVGGSKMPSCSANTPASSSPTPRGHRPPKTRSFVLHARLALRWRTRRKKRSWPRSERRRDCEEVALRAGSRSYGNCFLSSFGDASDWTMRVQVELFHRPEAPAQRKIQAAKPKYTSNPSTSTTEAMNGVELTAGSRPTR